MPYVDVVRRDALSDQRWRQARAGTSIVCLALLIVSCGSAGPTAQADETTTAPEPPGSSAPAVGPAATESVLASFDDAAVVATWTTINDPVMGGLSTSTVTSGDGGLVFSGTISLETTAGSPQPAVRKTPISGDGQPARRRCACEARVTGRPMC